MHESAEAGKFVRPIGPEFLVVPGGYDLVYSYGQTAALSAAGDEFGNFVIVWGGSDYQVRGVRVSDSNVPSASFELGGDPIANDFHPRVAMRPSGDFVVTWSTHAPLSPPSSPAGALVRLFDAGGAPGGDPFPLADPPAGHVLSPTSVAMADDGAFVVVWGNYEGDSTGIAGRRFDAAGAARADVFRVNGLDDGAEVFPVVAGDGTGGFAVVWNVPDTSDGDLAARRFAADGTAVAPEAPVNTTTSGLQFVPSIAGDAAGNFVVAWLSHDDPNIYGSAVVARTFDATGTPRTAESLLAEPVWYTGSQKPEVAVDDGGDFVVVWGDRYAGDDVFVRAGTASGVLGATFTANAGATGGGFPTIATGGSGDFLAVWFDPARGIVGRRLGPARTTTKLRLKDNMDAARRRLAITPVRAAGPSRLGSRIDPVSDGAFLHVYNAGGTGVDSACIALPAARWEAKAAKSTAATRFVYRDPAYADGPCASVTVVDRKVVKAACLAKTHPIDFSLDEPQQERVVVRFVTGAHAYCSVFGPEALRDELGRFTATNAVPAGSCPVAPAACP